MSSTLTVRPHFSKPHSPTEEDTHPTKMVAPLFADSPQMNPHFCVTRGGRIISSYICCGSTLIFGRIQLPCCTQRPEKDYYFRSYSSHKSVVIMGSIAECQNKESTARLCLQDRSEWSCFFFYIEDVNKVKLCWRRKLRLSAGTYFSLSTFVWKLCLEQAYLLFLHSLSAASVQEIMFFAGCVRRWAMDARALSCRSSSFNEQRRAVLKHPIGACFKRQLLDNLSIENLDMG